MISEFSHKGTLDIIRVIASSIVLPMPILACAPPIQDEESYVMTSSWGSWGTADGEFRSTAGITTDADGNVYVVDTLANRVLKYDSRGVFLFTWGSAGDSAGEFGRPAGITASSNSIYVGDLENGRIQQFSYSGEFQSAIPLHEQGLSHLDLSVSADDELVVLAFTGGGSDSASFIVVVSARGEVLHRWNYKAAFSIGMWDQQRLALSGLGWIVMIEKSGELIGEWKLPSQACRCTDTGPCVDLAIMNDSWDSEIVVSPIYPNPCAQGKTWILSQTGKVLYEIDDSGEDVCSDLLGNIYIAGKGTVRKYTKGN